MKKLRHRVDTQGYLPKDSERWTGDSNPYLFEFQSCAIFCYNKLTTFMKYLLWPEDSEKKCQWRLRDPTIMSILITVSMMVSMRVTTMTVAQYFELATPVCLLYSSWISLSCTCIPAEITSCAFSSIKRGCSAKSRNLALLILKPKNQRRERI